MPGTVSAEVRDKRADAKDNEGRPGTIRAEFRDKNDREETSQVQ